MQRVFVVDKNKQPLMLCDPVRAKKLLKSKRAVIYKRFPFTILILDREGGEMNCLTKNFKTNFKKKTQ